MDPPPAPGPETSLPVQPHPALNEKELTNAQKKVRDELLVDPLVKAISSCGTSLVCDPCCLHRKKGGLVNLRRPYTLYNWIEHKRSRAHAKAVANCEGAEKEDKNLTKKGPKRKRQKRSASPESPLLDIDPDSHRSDSCAGIYNAYKGKKKTEVILFCQYGAFLDTAKYKVGTYLGLPALFAAGCDGEGTEPGLDGDKQCKKCQSLRCGSGNQHAGTFLNKWGATFQQAIDRRSKATALSADDLKMAQSMVKINDIFLSEAGIELKGEAMAQLGYDQCLRKITKKKPKKKKKPTCDTNVAGVTGAGLMDPPPSLSTLPVPDGAKASKMSDEERWINESIHSSMPPAANLGIQVESLDETNGSLSLTMPLEGNTNVHGTAFAGSLYSLSSLCAWYVLVCHLRAKGIDEMYTVVLKSADISYKRPVTTSKIVAHGFLPMSETCDDFFNTLEEEGKATLDVTVTILQEAEEGEEKVEAVECNACLCTIEKDPSEN